MNPAWILMFYSMPSKPERNRFVSSVTFNTEFDITDANKYEFFNVLLLASVSTKDSVPKVLDNS